MTLSGARSEASCSGATPETKASGLARWFPSELMANPLAVLAVIHSTEDTRKSQLSDCNISHGGRNLLASYSEEQGVDLPPRPAHWHLDHATRVTFLEPVANLPLSVSHRDPQRERSEP